MTGRSLEISSAVISDIPELCAPLSDLFAQEAEFQPDYEAQHRGLEAIISNDEIGDILVVRSSGSIVGMVNLLYTISTALGERIALLEDMVIVPQVRGLGAGSHLLEYAIEFARRKDCARITLLTDDNSEGADRFYQRH